MRHISFRVNGNLPPKKDGANSMWGKETEAPRLAALRLAAYEALGGGQPFSREIVLRVRIYVGQSNTRASGDLDNFISGICDGLMAADRCSKIHSLLCKPQNSTIHPHKTIAICDDSQVIKICAEKLVGSCTSEWYEVEIEGY